MAIIYMFMMVTIKALLVCANADGNLAAQEKDWIFGYAAAGGVSDAGLQESENYQANESVQSLRLGGV